MKNKYFITGIGTDVGKTIVSAIITEALEADYWKPVQAGDLNNTDTDKVRKLVSNNKTSFHQSAYTLQSPMSPHAAAEIDGIELNISKIAVPKSSRSLVIEGAGGLLVPLNDSHCIIDLIQDDYKVILVSRHYLGSINHTLLSAALLKQRGLECIGIIFNGTENTQTETVIQKMTGLKILGRIENEPFFDRQVVLEYAETFKEILQNAN